MDPRGVRTPWPFDKKSPREPWKVGTLKVDFGMFRQINRPSRRHQRIPEGQIYPFSLREVYGSSGSRFWRRLTFSAESLDFGGLPGGPGHSRKVGEAPGQKLKKVDKS